MTRTSGVKQRENKNEARTGTAAAVAAAGGKIVAAGDTLGRPGRAGNRTSLGGRNHDHFRKEPGAWDAKEEFETTRSREV